MDQKCSSSVSSRRFIHSLATINSAFSLFILIILHSPLKEEEQRRLWDKIARAGLGKLVDEA